MKKLFSHQKKLIDDFPERHVLVHGTGLGKTRTSIELARKIGEPFLVICPKGLKANWHEEIKQWFPKAIYRVISKEEFRRDWDDLPNFPCLIVDECHYFLGMKSQMMKSLKAYFSKWNTKYRYFLSATIYRSTPWDIYKLFELIGKPLNYTWFKTNFFYEIPMGFRTIPVVKKGIEPEIAELVRKVGSVVRMDEVVDVPEQVFDVEYFELTKEQKKAITEIADPLPLVRYGQEYQICGGALAGDGYTFSKIFPSDKADRVVELALDNDRMIVVCKYLNEIEMLMDKLIDAGVNVAKITGAVEDRHGVLETLKDSKKYVLLVSAACSEGWQLKECPLMVFYSYDWSLKNYIQMIGRIQRIDNVKRNTYLSLCVKDTIDEKVFNTITVKKMDFHHAIMNE